jgi:hypothetical protein
MESLFEQFIKERKYLKGISPRTEFSYNNARRALFHRYDSDFEVLSKSTLTDWVVRMREAGLSPGAWEMPRTRAASRIDTDGA